MFFKKRGIEVFCSASVKAIKEDGDNKTVLYTNKNNEEVSISAKEVLIATGRKANIANLVKEGVDLNIDRGIIADNNVANYQGGSIYKMYGKMNITSSAFDSNKAASGGAVFLDNSS